ncbi:GTPase-associated protein 1-related protein [Saccharopolyspora hordei]|uniref:Uncharacterized protein n=1 Tax=Saccharopolyspora hordei TaxID=1838 RepID=A0A853AU63_9PSEU|nr:GTPase-associated protein 1-related protein [Saccharopolyspora hordei]NYI86190.1 hypothetical protein [Saccharopolyspora hordei]
MSAREFHSLYCTARGPGQQPGELEFRAVSPGTTEEMTTAVRRAVTERPSLVHAHDGVYVTARSAGTGEGEHVVHALVAPDAGPYGPIRPAQLWDAPWWVTGPAPSGECPAVPAEPETGFGVEALREWVLGQRDGESWLLAVHSAIDGGAPRVVFVSEDPGAVARWIAAATLLLPQESALEVGFQVFATDPQATGADVLALRPDQAGSLVDQSGVAVFNLVTGERWEGEPSAAAQHWVPRFLRADPFDVVDAVELSHRFAAGRGADRPNAADRLAAGVVALGEPVAGDDAAMALAEWLCAPPAVSGVDVLDPVLTAVLAADPGVPVLARLAEAELERAGQVRIALLRAEIGEIVRGTRADDRSPLTPRPWTTAEAERATALVENAADAVLPERMDLLLRTAARFDVHPRLDGFRQAAERFVAWWSHHPDAGVDPERWTCAPELLGLLRDALARRLQGPDADEVRQAIEDRWWRLLAPTVSDPFEPLDAAVASAAVAAGGSARQETVEAFRALLRAPERPGTEEAVYDALFGASQPTLGELSDFLAELPSTAVSDALAQRAFRVLARSTVNGRYLDVLRMLSHHLGDRKDLRTLWEDDSKLRVWLSNHRKKGAGAGSLGDISSTVLGARADKLVAALLDADPQESTGTIAACGEELPQTLVRALPAVWNDEDVDRDRRDRAVVLAFVCAWSDSATATVRAAFDRELEAWVHKHEHPDFRRVSRLLRGVDAEHATAWHEWLREVVQRGPKRDRTRRVARRLFGSRER